MAANILKARTLPEPRGFLNMLVGGQSDEILGFTVFGAEGSELVTVVQAVMIGYSAYTTPQEAPHSRRGADRAPG